MGKIFLVLFVILLSVAFFTRPDDKTCIIGGVRAVWGDMTPDPNDKPDFFENFMNLNSPNVRVKDWLFLKQIQYKVGAEYKTVAYGAFKNVFPVVSPIQLEHKIPEMPRQRQR